MTRFLPFLLLGLIACAPSGWMADKPVSYRNSSIHVPGIDPGVVTVSTEALSELVITRFTTTEADSVLRLLVTRTLRVPDPRFQDARIVSNYAESDFSVRITGIDIRDSRNPLHKLVKNGPVIVVAVSAEVYRGEDLVFRSSSSHIANLAALASTEPGYHKADESERNDPSLQRAMVLKAYYSAAGDILMSFFQVNQN